MDITHLPAQRRYEAWIDGERAGYLSYDGEPVILRHTKVEGRFEGRGVGSALARHALDEARTDGRKIVPLCPFIRAFLKRHPEYQDLCAE